jgi:hypothetical protein
MKKLDVTLNSEISKYDSCTKIVASTDNVQ